jgi:hypothetical protein
MTRAQRIWRFVILSSLSVYAVLAGVGAMLVQSLAAARVGIVGTLDSPPGQAVTLSVSLPSGYGLIPSEQRAGLPALNHLGEQEVTLREPFTLTFPRTYYCTHRLRWASTPPPPVLFVLRFSDAPDEEYVLYRNRAGEPRYLVRWQGNVVPPEQAAWRFRFGPFEHGPDDADHVPLWLLHVHFVRQSPASSGDSQPASA